jgi:hypothetical protein
MFESLREAGEPSWLVLWPFSNKQKKELNMNLMECLKEFGVRASAKDIKLLAEFVGVSSLTVNGWLRDVSRGRPMGEKALKAVHFLNLLGYHAEELDGLKGPIYDFGKAIAFGAISFEEAVQRLNYKKPSHLLVVLRGESGILRGRQETMRKFCKSCETELERNLATWREKLQLPSREEGNSWSSDQEGKSSTLVGGLDNQKRRDVIEGLARLLQACLPLAQLVGSDVFSANDREKLRELAGRETVHQTSVALTKLAGERARERTLEREHRVL